MFFRIKKLTADIVELEVGEEALTTIVLLTLDEVSQLRDMLKFIPTLPVAGEVDRWYTS
jgi:hypothetical protein